MKAVLFDLDGTLVKAGGAGRRALNRAIEKLYGVEEVCSEFSLAGRTDLDNFRLAFRKAKRRNPTKEEAARVRDTYLKLLPAEVKSAVKAGRYELVPGVKKLLSELKRGKHVLVGLGTGNVKPGAEIKLRPSGLTEHFLFGGFGCDGFTRVKMLKSAVDRASEIAGESISPRDVFVIGDTEKDVQAGKAAGFRTGVVTAGFGDLARIQRAGPELIAEDFQNVGLWLNWIGV